MHPATPCYDDGRGWYGLQIKVYSRRRGEHAMTTASPDDATIRRSDPVRTRAVRPAQQEDCSDEEFGEEIIDAITQNLIDPIHKRVRTLELELAQTRGALD